MFEVRTLQELARIAIRHTLRVTTDNGEGQPRGQGSFGGGRGLGVSGLHKYGPRFKRRRIHRRHCNSVVLSSALPISAPLDNNNNRGGQEEEQGRATRGAGEEEEEAAEEEAEEEAERETGELLRAEPPINILRERILCLPLPEPLKMYLLYCREK